MDRSALIDGVCGWECVVRILNALGYVCEYVTGNSKQDIFVLRLL